MQTPREGAHSKNSFSFFLLLFVFFSALNGTWNPGPATFCTLSRHSTTENSAFIPLLYSAAESKGAILYTTLVFEK
jgi:hypothetical protein